MDGTCETTNSATAPRAKGYRPPLESGEFNGASDGVTLTHAGAESPLASIADRDRFEVSLEFQWQGFAASETSHTLIRTGDLHLELVGLGGVVAVLRGTVGTSVLIETPIHAGLWYRVRWAADLAQSAHILRVAPWDVRNGDFVDPPGVSLATCQYRTFSQQFAASTDVWIGHDGTGSASHRFHGRLDAFQLTNYRVLLDSWKTTNCTLVP